MQQWSAPPTVVPAARPNGHLRAPLAPPLTISMHRHSDSTTVFLTGELDLSSRSALGEALDTAIGDARSVSVDLSGLEFIDASGLGALVAARHRAAGEGVTLALQRPTRAVARIINLAGLESLVHTGEEPAVRWLV